MSCKAITMSSHQSHRARRKPADQPRGFAERRPKIREFEELYQRWRTAVIAEAVEILRSDAAAEDAAERVFSRLWRNGGWWTVEDPEAYFRRAGRQEALDLRSRRREYVPVERSLADVLPGPTSEPASLVLREELDSRLEDELDCLPDRCGQVCRAASLGGRTREEIADDLAISRKAVGKQLARGRRYLTDSGFLEWLSSLVDGGVSRFHRLQDRGDGSASTVGWQHSYRQGPRSAGEIHFTARTEEAA